MKILVLVNTDIRKRWEPKWLEAHPDEMAIWPDKMQKGDRAAEASKVWQEQVRREIKDLVLHVRQSDYAGAVLGYFLIGGSGEWTDWFDFSQPALDGFRDWLTDRYPDVEALRRAWHDNKVAFQTAAFPGWKSLTQGDRGVFFDPQKSRQKIDFLLYHHSVPARVIGQFAKIIKEASQGESLVGLFHGYFTDPEWDGSDADPSHVGQFRMRHKSLAQIIEDPNVDFIASPYAYHERHAGGIYDPQLIANSILLHGKMAITEDDTRTHLTPHGSCYAACEKYGDNFGQAQTPQETLSLLQRNFAGVFTRPGSGAWYFGLSDRGNEWWDDPAILHSLETLSDVAHRRLLGKDQSVSQIAVIGSFRSACYQAFNNLPKELITRQLCENLHRLGAPFDLYLDTDLDCPQFPFDRYKLYIFLNTFYLESRERARIKEKICAGNRSVLWIWAPGLVDENSLSLEATNSLTGIRLRMEDVALDSVRCVLTNYTSQLTQGLPTNVRFGPDRTERILAPLLSVNDPDAEILGELLATTAKGNVYTFRRPGLCFKRNAYFTSIWSGVLNVPSCLLRSIARAAGVHIYDDGDDQVLVSDRLLAVHGRYAGERVIQLPRPRDVYDPFRKEYLGKNVTNLKVAISAGGTALWVLE